MKDLSLSPASFDKALLLICSNCSKQFDPSLPNASDRLKNELKILAKAKFNKTVRVVTSSCLGVCPKEKVAICYVSNQQKSLFSISEVSPDVDSSKVFDELFSHLE